MKLMGDNCWVVGVDGMSIIVIINTHYLTPIIIKCWVVFVNYF